MTLKAVVVLPSPPDPEGGASDRCAAGLIIGLTLHGVDVEVVAAGSSSRAPWLSNLRRPHVGLASEAVCEQLERLARDAHVIHVEQVEAGWIADGIGLPTSLHVQYRSHLDRDLGGPWTREFRSAFESRRTERIMIRRHRHLVANSDVVASSLRNEASAETDITVVPLTLESERYPCVAPAEEPIAGLIGTAWWPPTNDAIRRLIDVVWPDVIARVPEARLRIAGRETEVWRPEAASASIDVLGGVPSASAFLAGLGLLVYPVARGSGMKVKVLESLAMGIPVVTTATGAEGFAPSDGIVVASDDRALAGATAELLNDPLARRQRGAAGARDFIARYAPKPATAPLAALLRRMAEG